MAIYHFLSLLSLFAFTTQTILLQRVYTRKKIFRAYQTRFITHAGFDSDHDRYRKALIRFALKNEILALELSDHFERNAAAITGIAPVKL